MLIARSVVGKSGMAGWDKEFGISKPSFVIQVDFAFPSRGEHFENSLLD